MKHKDTKLYDNFFSPEAINTILDYMWDMKFYLDNTNETYQYQGLSAITFYRDYPEKTINDVMCAPLNVFADVATNKLRLDNQKKFTLKRVIFNVMTQGCRGEMHKDDNSDDHYTLIVNLSECDGGTEVNNVFYNNKFNQGLFFKSTVLHRGIGPVKNLARYNMAIIVKEEQ